MACSRSIVRGTTTEITGRADSVCPAKGNMESRTESRVALVILHLQELVYVVLYTSQYTDRLLPHSYQRITTLFQCSAKNFSEVLVEHQGLCVLNKRQRQDLQSRFRMNAV